MARYRCRESNVFPMTNQSNKRNECQRAGAEKKRMLTNWGWSREGVKHFYFVWLEREGASELFARIFDGFFFRFSIPGVVCLIIGARWCALIRTNGEGLAGEQKINILPIHHHTHLIDKYTQLNDGHGPCNILGFVGCLSPIGIGVLLVFHIMEMSQGSFNNIIVSSLLPK